MEKNKKIINPTPPTTITYHQVLSMLLAPTAPFFFRLGIYHGEADMGLVTLCIFTFFRHFQLD